MKISGMKAKMFFLAALAQMIALFANAQMEDRKDKTTAVTFEELYDEPYAVNKFFIGFQPIYGEVFATNVNAGYGVEASYYYRDKFDVHGSFRKSYSSQFFDLNRELAKDNTAPGIQTKPQVFNYFEIGGTYHWKDFESDGTTKIILYKKSYKGNLWAARVPLHAVVPCKVRKVYGARLGAIVWDATASLNSVLAKQGYANTDLRNSSGQGLPSTYSENGKNKQFDIFANIYSTSIYGGASISWIRNVAVSFDKYDQAVDDGMFTLFFDILYAPSIKLDPIKYTNQGTQITDTYSTKIIKTTPLGFRFGLDGKYNRAFSFGYGGELGWRPSIQSRGFYAMFKLSFPLFGTNLDYKVESFGK